MLHISELGEYVHRFLHHADKDGHVPEHGDHWRGMKFDHGEHDPHEEGISEQEQQRRMAYLDQEWWPNVIAQVNKEKAELTNLPGGNPIEKWRQIAEQHPRNAHGFGVDFSEPTDES
jgi:hypothetical protein